MRRCLERQERETNERKRRRAEGKRVQREQDQQVAIIVALLDEENQGRRLGSQVGRGPNVDRHRHSRGKNILKDYFIPTSLYSDVDFRRRYRMQPHLFNKVIHDICNYDEYFVQKCDATGVLGLLLEQKLTAVIQMLAYGSSADQGLPVQTYAQGPLTASTKSRNSRISKNNWKGQKSIILKAIVGFDTSVWHAFFRVVGSQNDLNVLGQSPVFNNVLKGEAPNITYEINNTVYWNMYYLADGIYPRGDERMFDKEVLRSIIMTCIILHNMIVHIFPSTMIVEDEYDYDAADVYEPDLMNKALTRIYERPMGPSGEPLEHEPLVRDSRFMTRMIDRYTEMQSSYIHERRQVDLMEHLWAVKGNDGE
ncbi:unnamed protein product [Prunus brigantina]